MRVECQHDFRTPVLKNTALRYFERLYVWVIWMVPHTAALRGSKAALRDTIHWMVPRTAALRGSRAALRDTIHWMMRCTAALRGV